MSSLQDAEAHLEEMEKAALSMIKELNATLSPKKKRKSKPKPKPFVRWRKRDKDGNIVAQRRKSPSSNSCAKRVRSSTPSVPEGVSAQMPDDQEEGLENALKELESLLSVSHDDTDVVIDASTPTTASDWKTRNIFSSERWKEARQQLVDNMLRANCIKPQLCQRCLKKDATIRCAECMPMQYYCCDCDISHHQSQALHNRASRIHGFHKPLPPTVVVKDDADGHYSHHICVRILPMEMPDHICECPPESLNVVPGRPIVFINMKGRYDLNLPELRCGSCCASWKPELKDVQVSGYWPATINFYTLYDVAIFQGFKEMKLVAPGNSRLSFMRMLDAQTTECGRTGKVCSDTFYKSFMEWVISSYEVNKLCSEQPFICPACCPQMLAVSVDGNRKHYRFKKDGCTDEAGYFEGVLLCKDDEVAAFVEDIQRRTKHVPGKGVCGRSQLNAAKETSKRSSSSLDEQGIEVAVCRHGIILRALNMFRGEIFAYPMFLQKEVSAISPPTFFCMDVICKYWPYISRICEAYPEYHHLTTMKPFLSVLHAKAHDKMGRRKSGWSWFHLGRGGGNGQLLPLQDCHKHQVYGKRSPHRHADCPDHGLAQKEGEKHVQYLMLQIS
ncbi:uncharacterized protein LOC128444819 isoform X1 [Pleuronectes platessa]|uniref:uncharacterized protein LOC128444819 isoform X1 n=2 Tax=Pleuronectes platessa TaxID=8262 RepID=UPI00232A5095|nr:uncharacterized protein LOC128444819 isoform X1 [Pleuronectes platessa]